MKSQILVPMHHLQIVVPSLTPIHRLHNLLPPPHQTPPHQIHPKKESRSGATIDATNWIVVEYEHAKSAAEELVTHAHAVARCQRCDKLLGNVML